METTSKIPVISAFQDAEASTDLRVLAEFEGKQVLFKKEGQKLWLSSKECGELLQTTSRNINKIFRQHHDEFDNDSSRENSEFLTPGAPPIARRHFSLEGLSLLCMFSRTDVAKRVRAWAKKLMVNVWTTGRATIPQETLNESLVKSIIADVVHAVVTPLIESQDRRITEMQNRFTQVLVPAMPDISEWPTPTQRLRALRSNQDIAPLPLRFNSGGSFDLFVAERHNHEFGNYPRTRCRRYMGKRPEFVIEVCPETDDLIRRCFKTYMKQIWEQPSLGLVQRGEGARDDVKGEALDGETGKAKGSRQNKLVHMRFSRRRNVKRRIKSE